MFDVTPIEDSINVYLHKYHFQTLACMFNAFMHLKPQVWNYNRYFCNQFPNLLNKLLRNSYLSLFFFLFFFSTFLYPVLYNSVTLTHSDSSAHYLDRTPSTIKEWHQSYKFEATKTHLKYPPTQQRDNVCVFIHRQAHVNVDHDFEYHRCFRTKLDIYS